MSEAAIPLQIVVSAQPLGIRITVRFPATPSQTRLGGVCETTAAAAR